MFVQLLRDSSVDLGMLSQCTVGLAVGPVSLRGSFIGRLMSWSFFSKVAPSP